MTELPAVGVVGLGNIGGAIAANLAEDGFPLTVADIDRGSVAEVAAASAITFTSLPTPEVVASVAEEWAAVAAPGAILVDLSTNLPEGNRALAARLADSGHGFVEAPLTGGAVGAQNRTLVFLVGGDEDAVAAVAPVLDRLGRATFHLGPVGTGSAMKLANSLIAFAATWSSLEALSLLAAEGVGLRTAVQVVRTGGASNFFIDRAVEGIGTRDRPAAFALSLAAKDAGLIAELAEADGVPAPLAVALAEVLDDAVARGLGDRDWSDLVVAAEARSGQTLELRPAD